MSQNSSYQENNEMLYDLLKGVSVTDKLTRFPDRKMVRGYLNSGGDRNTLKISQLSLRGVKRSVTIT